GARSCSRGSSRSPSRRWPGSRPPWASPGSAGPRSARRRGGGPPPRGPPPPPPRRPWGPGWPGPWGGGGARGPAPGGAGGFRAMVSESQPLLLGEDGRVAFTMAAARLSWLALGAPVLLALAARWAWCRTVAAPLLLWVGWTAALLGATLLQRRFFNSFAVCL